MGMAVAMLIGLWIYDETSFNKNHQNYKHIAQVLKHKTANGQIYTGRSIPIQLGDELMRNFSNLFEHVVISYPVGQTVSYKDLSFTERGTYIHSDGPMMLSLTMLSGKLNGLEDLNSIMVSQSLAQKLFGGKSALNKVITLNNKVEVTVKGVYQDIPDQSSFHYASSFLAPWDLYVSTNKWVEQHVDNWQSNFAPLYVQMKPSTNLAEASSKIKDVLHNKIPGEPESELSQLELHPMSRWHLFEEFEEGKNTGGRIQYIKLFGIIGVFVLLLACINFMNLVTARSEGRAKEIGVRKAIGSLRLQLVQRFLSESIILVAISFVISYGLVLVSLPWFNNIADKNIAIPWTNLYFWLLCTGFVFVIGLISGSYPSLYLSSFKAISAIKSSFRPQGSSIPRQVLVLAQFTISVVLVIGTVMVFRQIMHTQNREIGYNKERLITFEMHTDEVHKHFEVIRNELISSGVVENMAESSNSLTSSSRIGGGGLKWPGKDPNLLDDFYLEWISPTYGRTIGWEIVKGRDFAEGNISDQSGIIINKSAASYMKLSDTIGEIVQYDGKSWTILGVVNNLVVGSPYQKVLPTIYFTAPWVSYMVSVRLPSNVETQVAINQIHSTLKKYAPAIPFNFQYADQSFKDTFKSELRIGRLSFVFATFAVFISCLGLLGLVSFTVEKRTKEIGIRKVVGASMVTIWKLLSKEYLALSILASIIAIPISTYFLNDWLNSFEYRTSFPWWIFALTCIGAISLTLFTISYQAIKAAKMNPVIALRAE